MVELPDQIRKSVSNTGVVLSTVKFPDGVYETAKFFPYGFNRVISRTFDIEHHNLLHETFKEAV